MKRFFPSLLCLLLFASPVMAEDLYKWVDEKGVTHYGDAVPPEASDKERHILNRQAITVKVLDRQKTIDELNAMAAAAAQLEQKKINEVEQEQRDRVLLDTYLSAGEIERLRDRRILAIEARIGVTRHYLENLRSEWDELETDAARYNFPFDSASDKPPLPEELAERIVFTENAMAEHMASLQDLRTQQTAIRSRFESDLARFKMLQEQAEMASATP